MAWLPEPAEVLRWARKFVAVTAPDNADLDHYRDFDGDDADEFAARPRTYWPAA